jgi:hypothetical protein
MKLTANINVKLTPLEKRRFRAICSASGAPDGQVARQLIRALLVAIEVC